MMDSGFLFGLASAVCSAVSLGFMLIFDRVMLSDCYRGRPRQAWLVSSVLGSLFGLVATAVVWMVASTSSDTSLFLLSRTFFEQLWPNGVLMLIAGAITIQTMAHYFNLFSSAGHDSPNETLIALWLSSSPIFIFGAVFVLSSLKLDVFEETGLSNSNTSIWFAFALLLAVASLSAVEYFDSPLQQKSSMRYSEIFKMLACIVGYSLIISSILRAEDNTKATTIALQPYYWIGYLAGARVLISVKDRTDFRINWPRLKIFAKLILAAEVVGMLVYFFEYYALDNIDATLVNLVLGGHVIIVFILALALSRTRARFEAAGIRRKWVLGLRLVTHRLPNVHLSKARLLRLTAAQAAILLAIYASVQ